jgi:RIO-like serine/threonine protein kinase
MLISGRELSEANWDRNVGEKVIEAYDAIHALGAIHGDIRLENILVTLERRVWIIGFEF